MEETFLRSSDIVPVLVKSWEAAFLDVTHTASPVEFVEAISNIISASTTNDQRSHVLETACQTQAFWQRQHEAFTSTFTIRPDHLRSCALIVDPSSSLFLSKRSGEENTQIEVRYDPNGLSLYARVALTVIGLVRALGSEASSLVWVPSLVNRSWLLLELLKLRIIMDDYSAVSSPFLSDNEANLIEPWLWQSQNGSTLIDVQLFRNDVLAAVDNVLDLVVPKNLSTDVVVDVLKYLERRAVSDKNDFAHAILASAISRGQEIYGDESRVVKLLIQGLDKVRGNQFTSAIGASVARSMTSGKRALYPILLAAQKSMLKSDVEHTCNFCLEQAVSAKDFSRDGLLHLSVLDCMLTECRNRQEQGRSIGLGNTQLAQKVVKAARRYLENTASEIDEAVEIECVEFLQNTAAAAEGTLTPFARVKLHKTLKLASAITKVSRERSDTWRELSDEYWEHIFRIFVRECGIFRLAQSEVQLASELVMSQDRRRVL
ncbi:hypothetical protein BJ742DRAFT_349562 [Cladochytrium replicatum]|nr:hypothetical protein BJ742DRAFT_349562 [Cladochytrium replicatum]